MKIITRQKKFGEALGLGFLNVWDSLCGGVNLLRVSIVINNDTLVVQIFRKGAQKYNALKIKFQLQSMIDELLLLPGFY